FLKTNGSIKSVLITMVNSTEFWNPMYQNTKIKSPFELAISAIRTTNAQVLAPYQIFYWCNKMGQKFYYYQAPTGFPDRADYWINTGSLLSRMNFGLAFATQKIPGLKINLLALNNNHEPESADAALKIYSTILLPVRNNTQNIQRMAALIHDDHLNQKLMQETNKQNNINQIQAIEVSTTKQTSSSIQNNQQLPLLNQVVGVVIGSPEFQRK
ncbi:MAG: DUF1800 family protein, partial [Bacteroidota bacterium]|nr:DUF1800 family protein [Bacteroidota bacterium]